MIESTKAYINEIPANWKGNVKQGFGFGVLVGVITSSNKFISLGTLNSGLLKGAIFATASLVSSVMEPALKKLGNQDIQETIDIFARNFIVTSLSSGNVIAGLTRGSILAAVNAFSAVFCSKDSIVDKKDCASAAGVLNIAILYHNDPISGIKNSALLVAARVVCKKTYPFFQSKIAEYKVFERTGLNTLVDKLPSGWGLGCCKITAGMFIVLKSKGPKELMLATIIPACLTFSYLTNKIIVIPDNSYPELVRESYKTMNKTVESIILQS